MGPLSGLRIIEMKGLGPAPYAGMLLGDMGAEVIVVERASRPTGIGLPAQDDVHARGKQSIALDVKHPEGLATLLQLIDRADALIEGYRPGVAERLGFGPQACLARNPKLVYGRLTGWGQSGPLAGAAGHDINYIALTGALAAIGPAQQPSPPLNLVGDYGGGSLFLVIGILAALLEAKESGKGQVIDAAITDGTASLMSWFHGFSAAGHWRAARDANLLDGAAPNYTTYATADKKFVAIGALEPKFYQLLLEKTGLSLPAFGAPDNPARWAEQKKALGDVFKTRTQQQWCDIMEGTDVCFAPVLDYREAPTHAHNQARQTYVNINGIEQAAPAPRFSRTPCPVPSAPVAEGSDTERILERAGFSAQDIAQLRASGALS